MILIWPSDSHQLMNGQIRYDNTSEVLFGNKKKRSTDMCYIVDAPENKNLDTKGPHSVGFCSYNILRK